jgi:hypothetical protein
MPDLFRHPAIDWNYTKKFHYQMKTSVSFPELITTTSLNNYQPTYIEAVMRDLFRHPGLGGIMPSDFTAKGKSLHPFQS